jgi:acyl carrier protein
VLGRKRIGKQENFFDLGGHSLLLTQLAVRITEAFGVEVPLRVLFDAVTIQAMTLAIAEYQFAQADGDEMAAMLDELKHLSPEEINAYLAAEENLALQ